MTNLLSLNVGPVFPGYGAAPVETSTGPGEKAATAATENYPVWSAPSAAVPDSVETRATGDAQVAKTFSKALVTRSYQTSIAPPDVQVSPESTLGRWRTQLDNAFKSFGFLTWAKQQGLDTHSLKLDPARGELTGTVNGKTQTFSLGDDSGWSDVSRTLLSIAKAIAPNLGQAFSYPWPDGEVPFYTVGRFYSQPIDLTPAQQVSHRKKLQDGAPFEFAPVAHASLRSVEALAQQQKLLGDDANRHALIAALRSVVDDANGNIDLDNVWVPIDPRSGRFISEQRREMSVAQILKQDGNNVPVNSKQAFGVAQALTFDLAHREPQVDAGGVRPLAGLLNATSLRKMQTVVGEWKKGQATQVSNPQKGPGAGSLLHGLIHALPEATRKLIADNPSLALDQLIRSPEAQKVGEQVQKKLKLVETPTSAIESVSAALVQELDPGVGKSRFNLAGYNLYKKDNAGASPAEIVKRFTTYLESKVGVEAAPLAARLLLAAAAPEFLVKDIPPNLVYGAHTWTNFSIEVSRIEQQVPGASANMTFSQVMAFGDAPLISQQGEDQLSAVSGIPIITWGIANGVIESNPGHEYSYADVKHSKEMLDKQQKELEWARSTLLAPATTRKELALAELKRVFPEIDPTKKVLQAPWVKHEPVSLLDVYMTGPIKPESWSSLNNSDLPWEAIKLRLSQLAPDINEVFSARFKEYRDAQKSAWAIQYKYQISLLPEADRERIRQSNVSFIEVSRPFLGTEPEPTLSLFPKRRPRTPTAQELEDLKGRHGILMKVEGSDGLTSYYSYFPALGKIVKEKGAPDEDPNFDDSAYFGGDSKGRVPGTNNVYTQFGATNDERDSPETADKTRGIYFSAKNGTLALTASEFFTRDYDALKFKAAGVTEIEKGRAYDENLKSFFLSLIPFYDGIQDAIKGNVSGAIFNIGFDILGFILPGLSAARKSLKAGGSFVNVIKSSAFSGVGASVGYTDAVDIAKNLNRGANAGYKDIKYLIAHGEQVLSRLKGNYRTYDATKIYKEGDVVKGFYRAEDNSWLATVAVFKRGAWYAYSVVTNVPFGPQLAQFGIVSSLQPAPSDS